MSKAMILCMGAVTLAGCAAMSAQAPGASGPLPVAIESDSISYATSACFGRCPIYRVTVRPDGGGVFEGINFTAVSGERPFRITPDRYRAFAAHLAPLRPRQGEVRLTGDGCRTMATDLPGVEVVWTRAIGDSQTYQLNYGCDMDKNRAVAERLRNAPDLLPIAAFIGER